MHPYNYHFYSRPWSRGPSRVFYLILGAAAATWYHHVKYGRDHNGSALCRPHRQQLPPQEDPQFSPWTRAWDRRPTQEELSRQAIDAMDTTLDSVLRTVETLKAKLAEQRGASRPQSGTPQESSGDPSS
ncbi:hypothetical protein D9613_007908 [Agrocybe pediades]|uniref:Uncharacterized protein n=1 Tax=Agrocybe pediades TaxID=84607 RepID=A0A8H4QN84_9AGAR|nr:hypothetical protein D9613_007908 [Agrocybe pediades]